MSEENPNRTTKSYKRYYTQPQRFVKEIEIEEKLSAQYIINLKLRLSS